MSHLKNALEELYAEREVIAEQHKKLTLRLSAVEQGIESISHLLSDSDISNPIRLPYQNIPEPALDESLWRYMEKVLTATGPMRPKELADFILSTGYTTNSKDFPNVVGTNLRNYPEKFVKFEDGRWGIHPF